MKIHGIDVYFKRDGGDEIRLFGTPKCPSFRVIIDRRDTKRKGEMEIKRERERDDSSKQ